MTGCASPRPPASCPRRRIFIDESPALTPTDLRARARRIKREHGLDLVVVDYLQLMQVPGTQGESRHRDRRDLARPEGAGQGTAGAGDCAVAAQSRGRAAQREEAGDVGSAGMRHRRYAGLPDATAGVFRYSELVGTAPEVWSFDEAQRLRAARTDKVWHVGRKPVFRVNLASGRSIRATAEHRLLAGGGWTTVGKLAQRGSAWQWRDGSRHPPNPSAGLSTG